MIKKLCTMIALVLATSVSYAETIEVPCQEYAEKTGRSMPCDSPKWAIVSVDTTDYIIQQNHQRERDGLEPLAIPRPAWMDGDNLTNDEKPAPTPTPVPPWLQ